MLFKKMAVGGHAQIKLGGYRSSSRTVHARSVLGDSHWGKTTRSRTMIRTGKVPTERKQKTTLEFGKRRRLSPGEQ